MKLFLLVIVSVFFVESARAIPRALLMDIDDTLVATNPRTLEALHDVGLERGIPELVVLEYAQVSFLCRATCQSAGISDSAKISQICGDFEKGTLATSWWGLKFFSPQYLKYDQVISGAPQFLNRVVAETGSKIVYLSGRAEINRAGTLAQLRYFGFPDPEAEGELVLRGAGESPNDVEFKRTALGRLKLQYEVMGAFDDSKSNANMFRQELPANLPVVRPNQNIADVEGLNPNIVQITNYIYDARREGSNAGTLSANRSTLDAVLAKMK